MADFIKGLAEVKQNEIMLFLIDGFEKIIDQHSTFYVNSYIHIIHVLVLLLG